MRGCHTSKKDLTDFFTKWGFLRPFNGIVKDYSDKLVIVTQADIDAVVSEIKSHGYPTPQQDITQITDINLHNFKD